MANNNLIWSTTKIESLMNEMDNEGTKHKNNPFYDSNPLWRKGNIIYSYTKKELQELNKCANDIVYFANNYATVMTDDGLTTIKLRDYQDDMLNHFVKNRFSIVLASRQIGKCVLPTTKIKIKITKDFYKNIPKYFLRYKENDYYNLPVFELQQLISTNFSLIEKIKYNLYKVLYILNI